jgi:hypothetical protein
VGGGVRLRGVGDAQLRRIRADPANAGRLLEKHMARSKGAAYAEYVRRTSGFIPRPPRREDGLVANESDMGAICVVIAALIAFTLGGQLPGGTADCPV